MALTFLSARWLFGQFLQAELLAELLIARVVSIALLFFTGLLIFSNIISAFSTYYLSDELPALVCAPVSAGRLYFARLFDTWAQSSWMMIVFAMPLIAGSGPALRAQWPFYLAIPVCLLPLTVLCSAVGSTVTLLIARVLPARRTRDLLGLMAVVGFIGLYVAGRLAEPERFIKPDGFSDLVSLIGSLRAQSTVSTPPDWVVAAVFSTARGEIVAALLPFAVLCLGAAAACTVGAWVARAVYFPSFSLALEGRGPSLGERPRRAPAYPRSARHAFAQRDTRIFFRTPGQWSQLLLIGGLIVVYLFNFKHFGSLRETGIIGPVGLFFVNVALGGLVVTTIAARFLYPSVSLEGRAWWVVATAPIRPRALLEAKARWGFLPLLVLAESLTLTSNLMVGLPAGLMAGSAVVVAVTAYGLAGLAVGSGALSPRFDEDNPARIASSMGGVVFMLSGLGFMATEAALLFPMARSVQFWLATGRMDTSIGTWGAATAGLLLSVLVHRFALWRGARALDRRTLN